MIVFRHRLRRGAFLVLALLVLLPLAYWSRTAVGFAEPNDCLTAYYDACQNGDTNSFLHCIAPSFRRKIESNTGVNRFATTLEDRPVKNWVVVSASDDNQRLRTILVDEVRTDGISRVRFRLERIGGSWLIADLAAVRQSQPSIPFGTDVRTVLGNGPVPDEARESETGDMSR
jgi:hypothetical protein